MKFGRDIHGLQWVKPTDFGEPQTLEWLWTLSIVDGVFGSFIQKYDLQV